MLTASQVRDRVVAQIVTLPGWTLSRHAVEEIRNHLDGQNITHKVFAVGTPSTALRAGRQARSTGSLQYATTTVLVRWLYRARVDNFDADYSNALDAEDALRIAILAVGADPELSIRLSESADIEREVLGTDSGPLVFGSIVFLVNHQLANAQPA